MVSMRPLSTGIVLSAYVAMYEGMERVERNMKQTKATMAVRILVSAIFAGALSI